MDTRFLETFLVVIERGSLAEAARTLNVTPAAIAQRINALEAEIGHDLLQRHGRTVRPTPNAAAILEEVRTILDHVKSLRAVAGLDRPTGKLRVGAISTALTGVLPAILRRFFNQYPEIDMYVVPGSSSQLHAMVQEGVLDAAFIVEPPFDLLKIYDWHTIRTEPMVLLAPSDETSDDPFEIMAKRPFIRYDRNHWGGRLTDAYLMRHNLRPREQLELDSLESIAVMVNEGIGVSLVPDWASPWPSGLHVRKIRLPAPVPHRKIGLFWATLSPHGRLIARLLRAIEDVAPKQGCVVSYSG
ncbi:LysR family transcriptional regulator [Acetobacter sp. TBRC 12305]|uniref:LysR family transcriptional regulator n=1 Tax=Acetobacter garciniae TaxID=2817435 RepID=A0A939KMD3_9PROT|nr:LysR family transcriptional regulator [Acetobacter garciniae]MBO1324445.1 LysR family transcriptional regulator [Acetobacter garciniae]MBX0344134.1 LysR family transcriptional regulator [Acetobacter garciniae]